RGGAKQRGPGPKFWWARSGTGGAAHRWGGRRGPPRRPIIRRQKNVLGLPVRQVPDGAARRHAIGGRSRWAAARQRRARRAPQRQTALDRGRAARRVRPHTPTLATELRPDRETGRLPATRRPRLPTPPP